MLVASQPLWWVKLNKASLDCCMVEFTVLIRSNLPYNCELGTWYTSTMQRESADTGKNQRIERAIRYL